MTKRVIILLCISLLGSTLSAEEEISLEQDRKELEKLRKDIPEETKSENDDLAFILKLFDDKKRDSNSIRRQFDNTISRLRTKKQREFKKVRDDYNKQEKDKRTSFIAAAAKKRKDFLGSKPEKTVSNQFFEDERNERKSYFSDEKDKRTDFEADQSAAKKSFEEFISEKRKEFDDQMRSFKKDQEELKILEKQKKKAIETTGAVPSSAPPEVLEENQKLMKDFEKMPKGAGEKLAPPDEE